MAKYTNFNVFDILWASLIFTAVPRLGTRSKSVDCKVELEKTEAGERCFKQVSRRVKGHHTMIILSVAGVRGFRGKGWQ